VAGGTGTLFGPVVGAALVVILKNVVSAYITRWLMLLGVVFVAIVLFMPEGIVPGLRRLRATMRLQPASSTSTPLPVTEERPT
jgi:branched-chain amino acid transport system permease protein